MESAILSSLSSSGRPEKEGPEDSAGDKGACKLMNIGKCEIEDDAKSGAINIEENREIPSLRSELREAMDSGRVLKREFLRVTAKYLDLKNQLERIQSHSPANFIEKEAQAKETPGKGGKTGCSCQSAENDDFNQNIEIKTENQLLRQRIKKVEAENAKMREVAAKDHVNIEASKLNDEISEIISQNDDCKSINRKMEEQIDRLSTENLQLKCQIHSYERAANDQKEELEITKRKCDHFEEKSRLMEGKYLKAKSKLQKLREVLNRVGASEFRKEAALRRKGRQELSADYFAAEEKMGKL